MHYLFIVKPMIRTAEPVCPGPTKNGEAVGSGRSWMHAIGATWKALRFRSTSELRSLVESSGLAVNETVGAIYYPHIGIAALLLARFDRWSPVERSAPAA